MTFPDARRHPWPTDLAAQSLHNEAASLRYVTGETRQVQRGCVRLMTSPTDPNSSVASELLYGEHVTLFDETDGWAWIQNHTDGYIGYVRADTLDDNVTKPTHWVSALRTFLYPAPDMKQPHRDVLSLTSPVKVTGTEGNFAALADGNWVFAQHLTPWTIRAPDVVATAERLLGVPYLWGGRSSLGLDCSALVQIALAAAGMPTPRDSDMQRNETGRSLGDVPTDGHGVEFQRGDIVFFPGHVAFMHSPETVIHATAFTMTVTTEALADVIARAGGLLAVRRIERMSSAILNGKGACIAA